MNVKNDDSKSVISHHLALQSFTFFLFFSAMTILKIQLSYNVYSNPNFNTALTGKQIKKKKQKLINSWIPNNVCRSCN